LPLPSISCAPPPTSCFGPSTIRFKHVVGDDAYFLISPSLD
jgi:hypothetical protein